MESRADARTDKPKPLDWLIDELRQDVGHDHLSHAERTTLIRAARRSLDAAGLIHVPVIVGTGAGSTRETIELCKEAAEAGADYSIVIASGYFAGVLAGNKAALKAFWTEISEKSPIPVMIYNCALFFSHSHHRH